MTQVVSEEATAFQSSPGQDRSFDFTLGATYNLALLAPQPWGTDWLGKEYHLKVKELLRRMFRFPEMREYSKMTPRVIWKLEPGTRVADVDPRYILDYPESQQIWNPLRRDFLFANLGLSDYVNQLSSEESVSICEDEEKRLLGHLLEDMEQFQPRTCLEIKDNVGDADTVKEKRLEETFQILRKELIAKLPLPPPKHSRSYSYQKQLPFSREELTQKSWNVSSTEESVKPESTVLIENQQGDCSKNCRTRMKDRLSRWLGWLKKEDPCKTVKNISSNESRDLNNSTKDGTEQLGSPSSQNKQNTSWPGINLRFGVRTPKFKDKKSSKLKESSRSSLSSISSHVDDSPSFDHLSSDTSTESDLLNSSKGESFLCNSHIQKKEKQCILMQSTPILIHSPRGSLNEIDVKISTQDRDVYDILGRSSPEACNEEIDEAVIQSIIDELSLPLECSSDQRDITSDDEKFSTADDCRENSKD